MKNPLKAMKSFLKPHPRFHGLEPAPARFTEVRSDECEAIWPVGTWQYSKTKPADRRIMDFTIQGTLLESWARDDFAKLQAGSSSPINPGHYSYCGSAVPKGWNPREKGLKDLWKRHSWDPKVLQYIVPILKSRGRLDA
jgi:hypothetical protein